MKPMIKFAVLLLLCNLLIPLTGRAQSIAQCLQQLALDYQKLSGLRRILKQLYTGYEVVHKGYRAVQSVAHSNFDLHQAFLGGLLIVSPTIRAYPRITDIIHEQDEMMSEYQSSWAMFRHSGAFDPDELRYMLDVYHNLVSLTLKNLSDLAMVLSNNRLRMSDAERLTIIDDIYVTSHSQLAYLRSFDRRNFNLALVRSNSATERQTLQTLYGLH